MSVCLYVYVCVCSFVAVFHGVRFVVQNPLMLACKGGHAACVALLLDRGADVSTARFFPLPAVAECIVTPHGSRDLLRDYFATWWSENLSAVKYEQVDATWHWWGDVPVESAKKYF